MHAFTPRTHARTQTPTVSHRVIQVIHVVLHYNKHNLLRVNAILPRHLLSIYGNVLIVAVSPWQFLT